MKVGRIQTLKVARISDYGLYLADEEGAEVLLPNRYVSLTDKVGDEKSVFVYHDSENRLVATTEQPLITEGHVTGRSSTGASTARISSCPTATSRAEWFRAAAISYICTWTI